MRFGIAFVVVGLLGATSCTIENSPGPAPPPQGPPPPNGMNPPPPGPPPPGAPPQPQTQQQPQPAPQSGGLGGAWLMSAAPGGKKLPCPMEIEFFADGTLEMNGVSDDNSQEFCMFWRIPYQAQPGQPGRLNIGQPGHASFSCLYGYQGAELLLACEDRQTPPPSLADAMRFGKIGVNEGSGLAALAGSWRTSTIGQVVFTIAQNGQMSGPAGNGTVVVRGPRQLEIQRGGKPAEPCLYRVTNRRLTLACNPPGTGFPTSFAQTRTLVFTR